MIWYILTENKLFCSNGIIKFVGMINYNCDEDKLDVF